MTMREQILQEALALSPEDRVFVAVRLEESLSHDGFESPEMAAWSAEINRRIEAYERGQLQSANAQDSIERMRESLTEHRARKSIS